MKILLVNIKYLGDLIISTPAIKSLKRSYPYSEVAILVRKEFKDVFLYNPYIDKILTFNTEIKIKKSFKNFIEGIKLIFEIRKENFDVFISLHPGDRIAFLAFFSKAKIRIAPKKQSFGFLFNRKVEVYEDTISYIDYYNKIVSAYDVKFISNETEFYISEKEKNWANNFFEKNKLNDYKIICIHPGASEPSKIWSIDNYIKLINKIIRIENLKIILLSGPKDEMICKKIITEIKNPALIFYNSKSILLTAALIEKCNLLLTNDTGTRHLAVALKTPVLALLPEDNLRSWNFYDEINSHYSILGRRIINEKESFLGDIDVEKVYYKIREILKI